MRGVKPNGELLKELRRSCGMTQEELAFAANCDTKTVRRGEKAGRLDIRTLGRIADALRFEYLDLIDSSCDENRSVRMNLATVRDWERAYLAGDTKGVLSTYHEDINTDVAVSSGLPWAGVIHGTDAAREQFALVFDTLAESIGDIELRPSDGIVYMTGRAALRFAETGLWVGGRTVQEFRLRHGKVVDLNVFSDYRELSVSDVRRMQSPNVSHGHHGRNH